LIEYGRIRHLVPTLLHHPGASTLSKLNPQPPPDEAEELSKADPWDAFRRDLLVDLDRLADQLQYQDRKLTRAQAVAKAASLRPEVYDLAVLIVAEGSVQ
jgi:hypothetical protein